MTVARLARGARAMARHAASETPRAVQANWAGTTPALRMTAAASETAISCVNGGAHQCVSRRVFTKTDTLTG